MPSHNWRSLGFAATLAICFYLTGWAFSVESPTEPAHRIPIATLDTSKVFKGCREFNKKMEQMKVEIEQFEKEIRERTKAFGNGTTAEQSNTPPASASQAQEQAGKKVIEAAIIVKKQEFLQNEAVVYAEIYAEVEKAVMKISKARDIGIVIRTQNDEIKASDRASVLQGVQRQVIYSAVPDLTDEVIAELNR